MDNLFTQNLDESEDIPQTDNTVWILGKKYNPKKGKYCILSISMKHFVISRKLINVFFIYNL